MKVYLDNCTFNRPFDSQSQIKIRLETEAKLFIQTKILERKLEFVWSYILEYENEFNPYQERKESILTWKSLACNHIIETDRILNLADFLTSTGLKPKDALHISCAIESQCDYFITTDQGIFKRMADFKQIKIINPIHFITIWEDENHD